MIAIIVTRTLIRVIHISYQNKNTLKYSLFLKKIQKWSFESPRNIDLCFVFSRKRC